MLRPHLKFVPIIATLSLLCGLASAQEAPQGSPQAEQILQQAEALYEQLEYEPALQALVTVHQVPGVAPLQRARSFLYMGVCFTALGNSENAVQSFVELLKIKPDFRLPGGVSPSIKAMFDEALTRLKIPQNPAEMTQREGGGGQPAAGKGGVQVTASGPARATSGEPIEIKVEVQDPNKAVEQIHIRWRLKGQKEFSTVKVKHKPGADETVGRIPAVTLKTERGRLYFLVEAVAKGGMSLAHDGTMDEPLDVMLEGGTKKGSGTWKWWVIGVGAGLAVAGGVVAAVLLTRPDDTLGPMPNHAMGTVVFK